MTTSIRLSSIAAATLLSAFCSIPSFADEIVEASFSDYFVGLRGVVCEEGQQITRVRHNSMAQNAGLEKGDVVISINGQPVNYAGAWDNALGIAYSDGGWVSVEYRDADSGELSRCHFPLYQDAFL